MTTTAKDTVRADARQYNWAADLTDARDVFTRDEDRLIVEYTAKNGVLKSWAKSADDFDWRKIDGTSKLRKSRQFLRTGFII